MLNALFYELEATLKPVFKEAHLTGKNIIQIYEKSAKRK